MVKDRIEIIPIERIQQKIFLIRGHKIMLDSDLAGFYGVQTKELNKAVTRNFARFPEDFMFQLSEREFKDLKLQLEESNTRGGRRTAPYAFTEQGVAMLSAVLQSKRAVAVSVQIMRSFVKLSQLLLSNDALARRVRTLELHDNEHAKAIVQIIQELQKPSDSKKRSIGFRPS